MKIYSFILTCLICISITFCSNKEDNTIKNKIPVIDRHINNYVAPAELKKCFYFGMLEIEFYKCLKQFKIQRRKFINFGSEVDTIVKNQSNSIVNCGIEIMGFNIDTVYTMVAIFKNYECKRENVDSLQLRRLYFVPGNKSGDNYYVRLNDFKIDLK